MPLCEGESELLLQEIRKTRNKIFIVHETDVYWALNFGVCMLVFFVVSKYYFISSLTQRHPPALKL